MSSIDQINEFLNKIRDFKRQNTTYDLASEKGAKLIYHELIFQNVDENDLHKHLNNDNSSKYNSDSVFKNWCDNYKNNKNTEVFVSPTWKYFCQFISKDRKATKTYHHIKVYVPLDGDHIEDGVPMIFDFLAKNNISHRSKVSKKIRFDDIVIRLTDIDDTNKLLEFLKNNQYIQEGLIKPNPFAYRKNNIALACDGKDSYNLTVSTIIGHYIERRSKEEKLDYVSFNDFNSYMIEEYQKQFIDNEKSDFSKAFNLRDEKSNKNYEDIIKLIIECQIKNFSFETFINHYKGSSTDYLDELLKELVTKMIDRLGSYKRAISNVKYYYLTGDEQSITRKDGLRDKVKNSSFRSSLKSLLEKQGITFEEYVELIMNDTYSSQRSINY